MAKNQNTKATIRNFIRAERAELSPNEQAEKAQQLMHIVIQLPEFIHCQRLAGYWPHEGEINSIGILSAAYERGQSCYLPRLVPMPIVQMQFVEYRPGDFLTANRLRILEPSLKGRTIISAESLDLVLVPLVAFDETGRRLGMGKGYYDRTFAFRKNYPKAKPFLLGIAYDLQKVTKLPSETWDVPLDGIATETRYIDVRSYE